MIQRGPIDNGDAFMSLGALRIIAPELHRADVDAFVEDHKDDPAYLTVLLTSMEVKLA